MRAGARPRTRPFQPCLARVPTLPAEDDLSVHEEERPRGLAGRVPQVDACPGLQREHPGPRRDRVDVDGAGDENRAPIVLEPNLRAVGAVGDDSAVVVAPVPLERDAPFREIPALRQRGDVGVVCIHDRDVEPLWVSHLEDQPCGRPATLARRGEVADEPDLRDGNGTDLELLRPRKRRHAPAEQDEHDGDDTVPAHEDRS